MVVIFRRTGPRRYGVEVKRPPYPDVEMHPAPGYDEDMPHDLMHMIVEAQLGLRRGIFGQLAAGGDAGTFRVPIKSNSGSRMHARVSRRVKTRGKTLLDKGEKDCAQSERATFICRYEWAARAQSRTQRPAGRVTPLQVKQVRDVTPAAELRALSRTRLNEICKYLDELSSHWAKLDVGEAICVSWPDLHVLTE